MSEENADKIDENGAGDERGQSGREGRPLSDDEDLFSASDSSQRAWKIKLLKVLIGY